jgi:mannose/fructose-specific phosphotransferase system component IIA
MSEVPAVRGILLGHGGMARGLADAVQQITGVGEDVLVPLTNKGLSPEALAEQVRTQVGGQPAIVFTDLQSGSCGFVARRLAQQDAHIAVISGVNLALLLEFVMHRELPLEQLVPRLLEKGRASIGCAPAGLESHGDRAVSG